MCNWAALQRVRKVSGAFEQSASEKDETEQRVRMYASDV
jgi:hypothetical protein